MNLVSKNLQSTKQKLAKEKDELKTEVSNLSSSVKSMSTITGEVERSLLCIHESFFPSTSEKPLCNPFQNLKIGGNSLTTC